jgi:hypothetical protein
MTDQVPQLLLEEYRELFAYAKANALITLQVPPLVMTGATGLAVSLKEIPPLFGAGVALAFFIMLIWLGYCQAMVNGIGLRLVVLEQRINQKFRRTDGDILSPQ